jgi:nucleoside recognition membrane protein YjiH
VYVCVRICVFVCIFVFTCVLGSSGMASIPPVRMFLNILHLTRAPTPEIVRHVIMISVFWEFENITRTKCEPKMITTRKDLTGKFPL